MQFTFYNNVATVVTLTCFEQLSTLTALVGKGGYYILCSGNGFTELTHLPPKFCVKVWQVR